MSWVTDNVTSAAAQYFWSEVVVRGETKEQYNTWDGSRNWQNRAELVKVAHDPPRYERRLPNCTVEVFTFPDSGPATPYRRIFLTQVVDPQGQTLTFTHDGTLRLVAVTDALGQVATLAYADSVDPLRITPVTDPFGRSAVLTALAGQHVSRVVMESDRVSAEARLLADRAQRIRERRVTSTGRDGCGIVRMSARCTMFERLRSALPWLAGLVVFLIALEVLRLELRAVSWRELTSDVFATPGWRIGGRSAGRRGGGGSANRDWLHDVMTFGLPAVAELAWRWRDMASWITKSDADERRGFAK